MRYILLIFFIISSLTATPASAVEKTNIPLSQDYFQTTRLAIQEAKENEEGRLCCYKKETHPITKSFTISRFWWYNWGKGGMMEKKRSVGVIVFGILTILFGLKTLALHGIPFLIDILRAKTTFFPVGDLVEQNLSPNTIYVIVLITAFIVSASLFYLILCGLFIMMHKNWARLSLLIIYGCLLLAGVITVIHKSIDSTLVFRLRLWDVIRHIYCIIFIIYFTRPKIKEQFK